MLAISTAWNYKSGEDLRAMLEQIKNLGLDAVELGYRVTHTDLENLIPLLKEFPMQVSSVHNFCPVPFDGPSPRHPSNYYRLSSIDEEERLRAVKWTQKAVDTACRVNASVVVIHAGTVEFADDISARLLKLCKQGQKDMQEFMALRDEFLAKRKKYRQPFIDAVVKSLNDVLAYARSKDIKIGLETRYYPTEIPNYAEIGELLGLFRGKGMYYWHDFGHAEVNERLGIAPHLDYLKSYSDQLIGFHIHGVRGLRDHQAPFDGDFDLNKLSSFINHGHIKVIESHAGATAEQLKNAVQRLVSLIGE